MGSIIKPWSGALLTSRLRVPAGSLRPAIDTSNPLTVGLTSAFLPGVAYQADLTGINGPIENNDRVHTVALTATRVNTPEGPAIGTTTNDRYALCGLPGQMSTRLSQWTGQASLYVRNFHLTSSANARAAFYVYDSVNISMGISAATASNQYRFQWGAFSTSSTGAALTVPGTHGLLLSMISGGTSVLYADGVSYITSAGLVSTALTAANAYIAMQAQADTSTLAVYTWDRALSASEALALEADPYGIFTSQSPQYFTGMSLPSFSVLSPEETIPPGPNYRTALAATTQATTVFSTSGGSANTPSTLFFPRLQELPRTKDYTAALASTTQPVECMNYVVARTPSTYFFPRIEELPIRPDVIGTSLRATSAPRWPQAPPYDPAAVALFGQMAVQPGEQRKRLYNNIIVSLKAAGVWQKLDVLYVQAVETSQQSTLNWISPGSNTTTDIGSPTFTPDRGVSNGVYQTICRDSHYNPFTNGVHFIQNDASMFAWSLDNIRASGSYFWGQPSGAVALALNPWNAVLDQDTGSVSINDAGGSHPASPGDASGLFTASRSSSANYLFYRNTASLGTVTIASTGVPAVSMLLNATLRTMALGGLGSSLTSQNVTDLYNTFFTYLAAVNAIVATTPSVSASLSIQEDNPRRPDYRTAIAATAQPAVPVFFPPYAATPSTRASAVTPDPLRPDYSRTLASTTQPVRDFSFVQAVTPSAFAGLFVADDRPIRPDYTCALVSTTYPISPPQAPPPAQTLDFQFDLTVQEDNPRRPDYRAALASTTAVKGLSLFPALSPSNWFELSLDDPLPQRRDYSRALLPWIQRPLRLPAAAPVQQPYFEGPDPPLPLRPDYSVTLRDTTEPVLARDPCANLILNPGFESGTLAPFWTAVGPATTGVSNTPSDARTGTDSGFIFSTTGAMAFTRIQQTVTVAPNTDYTFSCWVNSLATTGGLIGVENTDGSSACSMGGFNNAGQPGPVDASKYQFITSQFNSGPNTSVVVFAGYTPGAGTSRIQLDDFRLVPNSCDPWFPSTLASWDGPQIKLPVAPDYSRAIASTTQPVGPELLPTATPSIAPFPKTESDWQPAPPDYRAALASTTRPLAPIFQPTVTPAILTDLGRWGIPNPRGGDYRAALASTTQAVGWPLFIRDGVCAKWGVGVWGVDKWCAQVGQQFFSFLTNPDELPLAANYRTALASTTVPVMPVFRPAVTPASLFDLTIQEDNPRRPDYRAALAATTRQTGLQLLPTPTPVTQFNLAIQEDNPRRRDYSVALDATCRPVTGPQAFAAFGTPSLWWTPPSAPLPMTADYRQALNSTTRPVLVTSFRTAVTPSTFFFPQWLPQYWPDRRWTVMAAGSGSRLPPMAPPPAPVPPPVAVCITTFQGHPADAVVPLVPGTATTVTLTSGHEVTVTLAKNSGCP